MRKLFVPARLHIYFQTNDILAKFHEYIKNRYSYESCEIYVKILREIYMSVIDHTILYVKLDNMWYTWSRVLTLTECPVFGSSDLEFQRLKYLTREHTSINRLIVIDTLCRQWLLSDIYIHLKLIICTVATFQPIDKHPNTYVDDTTSPRIGNF
jgi:hypothetical protein